MKTILLAWICGLGLGCAAPAVGDSAPELGLEQVMRAPEGKEFTLEGLKGKAIVLEFWATWCGPCVAAFPHINKLAKEFKDKDIVFISVTAESSDKVERFLKKKPLETYIGLDLDDSLKRSFEFRSIPQTVLIDADGKIAALTKPMHLKAKHLDQLIAGERVDLKRGLKKVVCEPGIDPLLSGRPKQPVVARLSAFAQHPMTYEAQWAEGQVSFINMPVRLFFINFFQMRSAYIRMPEDLNDVTFDVIVNSGLNPEREALGIQALNQLGYQGERLELEREVLILRAPEKAAAVKDGARVMPIEKVRHLLEAYEGLPVIDESGLGEVRLSGLPKKGYIVGLREMLIEQGQLMIEEESRMVETLKISSLPSEAP